MTTFMITIRKKRKRKRKRLVTSVPSKWKKRERQCGKNEETRGPRNVDRWVIKSAQPTGKILGRDYEIPERFNFYTQLG